MMLTFDKYASVTSQYDVNIRKDSSVKSQYDGNIRRDASSHHSMMLTFDKDASVTSQYDINIRQRCLSRKDATVISVTV